MNAADLIKEDNKAKRICKSESNLSYIGPFQYKVTIRRRGFPTICKTYDDIYEALQFRDKTNTDMRLGTHQDSSTAKKTILGEILDRYATEVVPIITSTEKYSRQLQSRIRNISSQPIGQVLLAELGPAHLQAYRDTRRQQVKRKTVKEELSEISRVIEYARHEWHIHLPQGNPVNVKLLLKHIPNDRTERQPIRSTELEQQLLDSCSEYGDKHSLRDLVELGLRTGMRRTQLVNLNWEHIYLDEKIAYVHNKDRRNDGQEFIQVPLLPEAITVLNRIGPKKTGSVFIYSSPDSVTKALARVRAKHVDIPDFELITPHTLRHTVVHRLKKAGIPSEVAKLVTGHKTDQMHTHYGKLQAKDVVEMLNPIFNKPSL